MRSKTLAPHQAGYPEKLLALPLGKRGDAGRAPPTIYVRGALPALPGIAIVGTRQASDEAKRLSSELARGLVAAGYAVWSGGARGIDAAAHEGALDAEGITVVVAGGGLDRPYPAEHAQLFDRVLASGGALVARAPDDAPPMPAGFLQRNAVLAAMTDALVVVEAGFVSGARSAAAAARKLGRPVYAVPHAPWDPAGAGCAAELVLGARAVTSAPDLVHALTGRRPAAAGRRGGRPSPAQQIPLLASTKPPPMPGSLDPIALAAHAVLGIQPLHLDEVCEKTGFSAGDAAAALLTLTLHGVVVEGPAGLYRRVLR